MWNHEETYVPSGPMTAALISQGELGDIKDRELKWSQEEKAWIGKEEGIYRKQENHRLVYLIGGKLVDNLEIYSIRRKYTKLWNRKDEEQRLEN